MVASSIISSSNQEYLLILSMLHSIVCTNYYLGLVISIVGSTPVRISPLVKRRKVLYVATSSIPGDSLSGELPTSYDEALASTFRNRAGITR